MFKVDFNDEFDTILGNTFNGEMTIKPKGRRMALPTLKTIPTPV